MRRLKYLSVIMIFIVMLTGCLQQTYSILFVSNGGSIVNAINDVANTPIEEPNAPTKVGHTFDGWYTDEAFTSKYTFGVMPSNNLTLYAKWNVNTYTLTFESNGGNEIASITLPYNTQITLPTPVNGNLIFVGWFKDPELTKYFNKDRIPAETLTLYAKWTDNAFLKDKEVYRIDVEQTIQDAYDAYYGESGVFHVLPSKGDVNLLVIPIQFPDDKFTSVELARISNGFFGSGTSYETLKSYYLKSSYGTLNLSGTVLSPYTAKQRYDYYNDYSSQKNTDASGVDLLIEELVNYYKVNQPNLDLSLYDSEGDYNIDAIHLVYSSPVDYVSDDSIYWAFQYYYMPTQGVEDHDYIEWGDYYIDAYVFSGVDFFYENRVENAWTIIHETGHLLGLEDYYDYTEDVDANKGGLGGTDMMDFNLGDHNSFSKLLLDWIDPIVVSESMTIKIDNYETSGDAIIVSKDFDNIFDDYFIMHYYTPTYLNEDLTTLSESGLIMYDVKAYLPTNYGNLSDYSYFFINNNSDTQNKLIDIIEADGRYDISKQNSFANNNDLLQKGDSITLKKNNLPYCKIEVIEQTKDSITLTFTYL